MRKRAPMTALLLLAAVSGASVLVLSQERSTAASALERQGRPHGHADLAGHRPDVAPADPRDLPPADAAQGSLPEVDERDPALGPIYRQVLPARHFRSLAQMAASADMVVKGAIVASGPGRSDGHTRYRNFTLSPTRTWKGRAGPGRIVIEQMDSDVATGRPLVLLESVHLRVGQAGTFFLRQHGSAPGTARFSLLNAQAVTLEQGGMVVRTGRRDPLVQSLEGGSEARLDQRLAEALR